MLERPTPAQQEAFKKGNQFVAEHLIPFLSKHAKEQSDDPLMFMIGALSMALHTTAIVGLSHTAAADLMDSIKQQTLARIGH